MLASPDFEEDFYIRQNEMMCLRYSKIFEDLGINWKSHIKEVRRRLDERHYWIWNYLVVMERLLKTSSGLMSETMVDDHKEESIKRIVGDFYRSQVYVRQL